MKLQKIMNRNLQKNRMSPKTDTDRRWVNLR